ncbi:MAG: HD domain-containing protein [Acidobacteria bacterium]|nr:HD domain-containing protein [Acidobacteriota bacterium]MBI3658678.1 HD domain-containing protein [Acidobacteriota bacterium]
MGQTRRRTRMVYSLLVGMLLIATVPLILNNKKLIQANEQRLATDQRLLQLSIAKHLAAQISTYLESCYNQMDLIKRTIELSDYSLDNEKIGSVRRLLEEQVKSNENFIFLRIVNSEGKGVRTGYEFAGDRTQAVLDDAFRKGLADSYFIVSKPYYVDEIDQVVTVLSKSIMQNKKVVGVVSSVISFEPIVRFVQESSVSRQTAYIVNTDGTLIAHPDKTLMRSHVDFSDHDAVKELQRLKKSVTSTKPFLDYSRGKPVEMIGSVTMIPDIAWGVVVQTEKEAALYSIREMKEEAVKWIAMAIGLSLLLAITIAQRVSGPLAAMAAATRSIAAGNFDQRVTIKSNNELGELADHFNVMVERIRTNIEQLKQMVEEKRQMFVGLVKAIAATIDEKDPYTRGHSERVSGYAVEIARSLGMNNEELEKIKIGGLLHDVGKIGIEDSVLKKPAKYTEDEYMIMKQHPSKGAHIMALFPQFRDIVPAMHSHHEQWDGKGYPQGLRGEEIPIIARIISVADCFDAMTLRRIYQSAFDPEAVIAKIKGWGGTRYDHAVVDALIKAYDEGRIHVPQSLPDDVTMREPPPPDRPLAGDPQESSQPTNVT